jgi:hypothetical protein
MRWLAVLFLGVVVGGCASGQQGADPDYQGVEEAAEEAQRELERSTAD